MPTTDDEGLDLPPQQVDALREACQRAAAQLARELVAAIRRYQTNPIPTATSTEERAA